MIERRYSLDTPEVTGRSVYSAANFREVCPEVLSPLSFSMVGAGMEMAFRDIAAKVGIETHGDDPRFVAYVAFRPFHVMSSLDEVTARLPLVTRADIWELLLGGPPPLHGAPRGRTGRARSAWHGMRMSVLVHENGTRAGATMEAIAHAEAHALVALDDERSPAAGAAVGAVAHAGRRAWALHARTTTLAVAVASVLRRLYAVEHGEATATEMIRLAARRGGEAAVASASVGRLSAQQHRLQGYEVADRSPRFRRWSQAQSAMTVKSTGGPLGEHTPFPAVTACGRVAAPVARLLDTLLAERERSKELGLRALHAMRLLIQSAGIEWEPGDASLLSASELVGLPRASQAQLIETRAAELADAARLRFGPDVRERDGQLVPIARPSAALDVQQQGTALSPGFATGQLVREVDAGVAMPIVCGSRVDGNYVLAVKPAGVITTFGSLLSHVAIVCRELQIPLVSGIEVPDRLIGAEAVVDGWTGAVETRCP